MNEFKDVFVNMHTAPYDITTVKKKESYVFLGMIIAITVICYLLIEIQSDSKLNVKTKKDD